MPRRGRRAGSAAGVGGGTGSRRRWALRGGARCEDWCQRRSGSRPRPGLFSPAHPSPIPAPLVLPPPPPRFFRVCFAPAGLTSPKLPLAPLSPPPTRGLLSRSAHRADRQLPLPEPGRREASCVSQTKRGRAGAARIQTQGFCPGRWPFQHRGESPRVNKPKINQAGRHPPKSPVRGEALAAFAFLEPWHGAILRIPYSRCGRAGWGFPTARPDSQPSRRNACEPLSGWGQGWLGPGCTLGSFVAESARVPGRAGKCGVACTQVRTQNLSVHSKHPLMVSGGRVFFFLRFYLFILRKRETREKERDWGPGLARNPGMCPARGWNRRRFCLQVGVQPTEPHPVGLGWQF